MNFKHQSDYCKKIQIEEGKRYKIHVWRVSKCACLHVKRKKIKGNGLGNIKHVQNESRSLRLSLFFFRPFLLIHSV